MTQIDPKNYPESITSLLAAASPPPLGPGKPNRALESQLDQLSIDSLGSSIRDRSMGACCLAGLWLLHNYLDRSHEHSQRIQSATGSYWHGIMHRREPDFSNAKYWFRRVGDHEIFPELCRRAQELAQASPNEAADFLRTQASWDPFRFVDLCQQASGEAALEQLCIEVSYQEWQLLFDYSYREAVG